MSFTPISNPFRQDLPAGLRPSFFATQDTATALATAFGGEAFLEPTGGMSGALEPAWFISFPGKRVPWNAGDLYVYVQNHPEYNPAA
jgi:hypothetical protein